MFDFQKEVVINSVKQFGDPNAENVVNIVIDGMVYKPGNLGEEGIFRTKFVEGNPAEITINLSDVADGKKQVRIELGLDRDYRGSFGSALYYSRKPILIDFREPATAKDLEKAAKAVAASNDGVLRVKSADDKKVVFEASDDYITVRKAEIVKFGCANEYCNGDEMEVVKEVIDLKNPELNQVKDNVVSFGTYEYLIHNLRLPTYANIRFASPAAVEMPVLGGKYWQYSFEYAVPRRIGGLSVVGQKNVSVTTHTFFVLDGDVQVAFDKYISKLNAPVDYPKVEEVEDPEQAGE